MLKVEFEVNNATVQLELDEATGEWSGSDSDYVSIANEIELSLDEKYKDDTNMIVAQTFVSFLSPKVRRTARITEHSRPSRDLGENDIP